MIRRILVVEDDATIARAYERLIRRILRTACEIVVADNAEAAILLVQTEDFDLVVSDYNLAGERTGADVLAAVRSTPSATAFLFVSSDEAVEALGAPFLSKPCPVGELRSAIGAAIGVAS